LVVLAYIGHGIAALRDLARIGFASKRRSVIAPDTSWLQVKMPSLAGAVLLIGGVLLTLPLIGLFPFLSVAAMSCALGLAALGMGVSWLLGFWFFLSFAPFFMVYTEIVHLSYATVPAAIIICAGLRHIWASLHLPIAKWIGAAILSMLVLDQGLNV